MADPSSGTCTAQSDGGERNDVGEFDRERDSQYLATIPEINKVYKMKGAYAESGIKPLGYYRFDGTNWYHCNDVGDKWWKYIFSS